MFDPGCTSSDGEVYSGNDSVVVYEGGDGDQSCTTQDSFYDE